MPRFKPKFVLPHPRMAILAGSIVAVLGVAVAVAYGYSQPSLPCFSTGSAAYRVTSSARSPDFRVAIDNKASQPDLRLTLVDREDGADFVLIDEPGTADTACRQAGGVKTIQVGTVPAKSDVTVSMADPPAADAFKLYVQSARFSKEDAAALFAVIWKTARPWPARDQAQAMAK